MRGMSQGLLLLPIVIPLLFWAAYHYHKDRHLPEPPGNLLFSFVLGVGSSWIARALYIALEPVGLRFDALLLADTSTLGLFAYSMLAIGPIEEIAKILPFLIVVLRFRAFDETIDGIIYASFIALGFAAAENLYYLDYLTFPEAVARGFAGPVVHIVFASIWGYSIGHARINEQAILRATFGGLILASILHGLYDFLVLLNPFNALPYAAILIVAVWVWRLRLMHRLQIEARATASADKPKR